jgi:hypothetical protein
MLQFGHLNYGAFAAAALINIVVGAFWYSPAGFGKLWSKLTGVNMMEMPKDAANKAIGIVAVSAIIQSFALAVLIKSLDANTILRGVSLGLLVWLGFTASTTVGDTLYARRGWKLWWVNSSFFLVVMLINATLLSAWR